jgi:hypothetical protein
VKRGLALVRGIVKGGIIYCFSLQWFDDLLYPKRLIVATTGIMVGTPRT